MNSDTPKSPIPERPPPTLDRYYREVGRIASEWSSLEFTMDYLIWQLARVDQQPGTCITSQLNGVGARLRTIIALLRLRQIDETIVKKFQSFDGSIQYLLNERNRAVHDTWAMDSYNRAVQLRLAVTNKRLEFGITPINLEKLREIFNDITIKNADLRNLIAEAFEIWPPSPGISPYIPPKKGEDLPNSPDQNIAP
jgi:hypothetical protein